MAMNNNPSNLQGPTMVPQGWYYSQNAGLVPSGPLVSNNPMMQSSVATYEEDLPLPEGWEKAEANGRVYFIDHVNKTTSWEDPRKKMRPPQPPTAQPPPGTMGASVIAPQANRPGITPPGMSQPGVPIMRPPPGVILQPGVPQIIAPPGGLPGNQYMVMSQRPPVGPGGQPMGTPFIGQPMQPIQTTVLPAQNGPYPYQMNTQHLQTGRMMTNMMTNVGPKPTALALTVPTYPPQEGPACIKCGSDFTLFKGKHHCRCCTREFCDNCSKHRQDIKSFKLTTARVCDFCNGHLSRKDESCLSRLVPYLMEPNEDKKGIALLEIASLVALDANIEGVPTLKFLPALMSVLSFGTNDENKSRALGVMAQIASKGLSLTDLLRKDENLLTIINCLAQSVDRKLKTEALKCIAFLAMQAQNKTMFVDANVAPLLTVVLDQGASDEDMQWAAMAIYYLASSSLDDVVPAGLYPFNGTAVLVRQLQTKTERLLQFVTGTLDVLANHPAHRNAIYENGGIEPLLRLTEHSEQNIRNNVLSALNRLSVHDGSRNAMVHLRGIKLLVELIESTTEEQTQEKGLNLILKLSVIQYEMATVLQDLVSALPFITTHMTDNNANIKKAVLDLLLILSNNDIACEKIGESGVLLALTSVLSSANSNTAVLASVSTALHIFGNLARSDTTVKSMVDCGALMAIVELLASQNQQMQLEASRALTKLSANPKVVKYIPEVGGLQALLELLYTQNAELQENVVHVFANLASDPSCASRILNSGEIENIARLLMHSHQTIQRYAAQIMQNLAKGEGHGDILGRIPGLLIALISLLSSPFQDVKECACNAVVECCRTSATNREVVSSAPGGIQTMVRLLSVPDPQIKAAAAEVISLFSMEPKYRVALRESGCLALLVDTLGSPNENIQKFAAISISNIAVNEKDAETIYTLGGIHSLVNLLGAPNAEVVAAASLAITNIAHNDVCRQALVEAGAITRLLDMLYSQSDSIKLQAISALSMLSANRTMASTLPQQRGFKPLVSLLATQNTEIREHAVRVIMNVSGDLFPQNWQMFVTTGGIPALVVLASSQNLEAKQKAVHEIATMSVDVQYHKAIFDSGSIGVLIELLQPDSTRPMGSHIQVEAILVIANMSQDINCLDALVKQNGVKPVVDFLDLNYGTSASFSAGRIVGNLTQLINDRGHTLEILRDAGAIPKLVSLLPLASEEELKFNVCAALAALASLPDCVSTMVELGVVTGFVQLLSSQVDERIRSQTVKGLRTLSTHPECRIQMIRNKHLIGTLLSCAAEPSSRYAVLEILQPLAQMDTAFADALNSEEMAYLLQILVGEMVNQSARRTALNILANLSKSTGVIRGLMFQFKLIESLVHFLADKTIMVEIVSILGNLAVTTEAKTKFRNEGVLKVLLDLLAACHVLPGNTEQVFDLLQTEPDKPLPPSPLELDAETKLLLEEKLISALVALSFSEQNREQIQQSPFALGIIVDITVKSQSSGPQENELLVQCINLIDTLLYDLNCRQFFQDQLIIRRLFALLASSRSQKLTSQILSLVQNLTRDDERNMDIIRDEGMMPLVSLLSNDDDYVVTQALLIIKNLVHFDASREMVKTYIDQKVLTDLLSSPSATIKQLATSAKHILGL